MTDADKILLMDQILSMLPQAVNEKLSCAEQVLKRITTEKNHPFAIKLTNLYFKNPKAAADEALNGWPIVAEVRPAPPPTDITGDYIIQFGKHRGMALDDLIRVHKDYCAWLLTGADFFNTDKYRSMRRYVERSLGEPGKQYTEEDPQMKEIPF